MAELKWLQNGGNYYYFKDAPTHASGITLNKNSIILTEAGQTYQLVATVTPTEAIDKSIIWTSSDESIATVNPGGLVTCVTPGNCTITASCDGVSATCSVFDGKFIDFLLIAGGGAGGNGTFGGGGGAGGVIECSGYLLETGSYGVTIGAGGNNSNGGNSLFGDFTAIGGGRGGTEGSGYSGGSGGGGSRHYSGSPKPGGSGTPGQGCNGGSGNKGLGGGGGGARGNGGGQVYSFTGGVGGLGVMSDISGQSKCYAGGGGGAASDYRGNGCYGGGNGTIDGGGGNASTYGSGGGGGAYDNGGKGCQGVFILRYPTSCGYNMSGGCKYTCGNYTIHCFTSNGTLTVS